MAHSTQLLAQVACGLRGTRPRMRATTSLFAFVALTLAGCASNGSASGEDVLPKRGERATDPTIVAATAHCYPAADGQPAYLDVVIDASDPAGRANLGTCAATVDGMSDRDSFGDSESCYCHVVTPCSAGQTFTVDMTVSNSTGGITTASVGVVAGAGG
jgi:hypothetical protein